MLKAFEYLVEYKIHAKEMKQPIYRLSNTSRFRYKWSETYIVLLPYERVGDRNFPYLLPRKRAVKLKLQHKEGKGTSEVKLT